jgi:hypothetical protein
VARLQIPPDQRQAFKKLVKLDDTQRNNILTALGRVRLRLYQFELADAVADDVKSVQRDDIEAILEAVWPLAFLRANSEAPIEPFSRDIQQALVDANVGTADEIQGVMPSIIAMMQTPSVAMSAKARVLLLDGNSYCRARILTDVRPVFGDDASEAPRAALIVHHLTLSYHKAGPETEEMIVSLDSDDIDDLMKMLERAKAKERQLHLLLSEAKLPALDAE